MNYVSAVIEIRHAYFTGRKFRRVWSEKTHKIERLRKLKPFKLKKYRHKIRKIELSLLEKFYTLIL